MKRNLFLIILVQLSVFIFAQDWVNYNTANTLFPSNPYKVIKVDQQGNKWVGTQFKGIYKYDGTNWEIFNTSNSSLPSDQINDLAFDAENNLWICTATGGLAKYSASGVWTIYNKNNSSLPVNDVNSICFDKYQNKWIATKNGLALLDNNNSWIVFNNLNSGMISNDVLAVTLEEIDGVLIKWIGTANGLIRYNDSEWEMFNTSNSALTGNAITNIHVDKNYNKWISVYNTNNNSGGGLIKISLNNIWTVYNMQNSLITSNIINCISSDSLDTQNTLWIGTDNGLAKLVGSTWTSYTVDNTQGALLSNQIYSLAIEGSSKWLGTDKLMMKYNGTVWTSLSFLNSGVADNKVNAIFSYKTATQQIRWIGTAVGLSKFDGTNWTVYNMANSPLPSNNISSLNRDINNRLWIGTKAFLNVGGGLVSHDPESGDWFVYTTINSSLPSNNISSIATDRLGNIWVGTQGAGLLRIDPNFEWIVYNENNSELCSNNIQSLNADLQGNLWISSDYGISVFNVNSNMWTTYNTFNSSLSSNNIKKISFSYDYSNVWIATDNGLVKKTGNTWLVYKTSNSGLPLNLINDVQADSSDFVWIATNSGLVKTDELNWQTFNTSNSQISSNQLNSIFLEYNENRVCEKWLASNNIGLIIYKKSDTVLDKGLYLSVLQHDYIPSMLNINAFTNRILADTVYLSINNQNIALSRVNAQHWKTNYNVSVSSDLSIKFRALYADIDTTIVKNMSVTLLNNETRYASSYDKRLQIASENSQDQCLIIADEINEGSKIYQISSSLSDNYSIKYFNNSSVTQAFAFRAGTWSPLNLTEHTNYVSASINGVEKLKFVSQELLKPEISVSNYPNPFNPLTHINLSFKHIEMGQKLKVSIYNLKGEKITVLYDAKVEKEDMQLIWNANIHKHKQIASGVYFYQVEYAGKSISKKMLLLK